MSNINHHSAEPSLDVAPDEAFRRLIRGHRGYDSPIAADTEIDVTHNIVVSAGAGSGKTTVLIERMVALIRLGIQPESIVAITFTKKAAGELQERFFKGLLFAQKELEEKIAGPHDANIDSWKGELALVERAVIHNEDAYIGTIHAFCLRLLKQRSLQAGLPPDFEQIDDAEELRMRRVFWHKQLAREREDENADLTALRQAQVSVSGVFNLFGSLCKHNSVTFELSDSPRPELAEDFKTFDDHLTSLKLLLPISDDPDVFLMSMHRTLLMLSEAREGSDFEKALVMGIALEAYKSADSSFSITMSRWGANASDSKKLSKKIKDGADELAGGRSLLSYFEEELHPLMERWRFWLHDVALRFTKRSVAAYRQERLEAGSLTYDELLAEAGRLVMDSSAARKHFQIRYSHILVDEFQDTDPQQAALLFALCSDNPDPDDWTKSPLLPGRLFVVGDDKQSIYRFRKADFQAFSTVRTAIEQSGGRRIELSANFRSDVRICNWVNKSVGELFSRGVAPYQAEWSNLVPARGEIGPSSAIVNIAVEKGSSRSEAPAARAEAHAIAEWIHELVRQESSNAPGYGDFKILVRGHSKIPLFLAELSACGIPVGVAGGKAENAPRSLPLIHDLLLCLLNPDDGVALVSTLRGLLFGVSDVDLLKYRKAGGDWRDLMSDCEHLPGIPASIESAHHKLKEYAVLFRAQTPATAFEHFLRDSGVQGALRLRTGGEIEGGMLERISVMLTALDSSGHSFAECVAELTRYRKGELKLEPFSENAPFGSCAQIMTVHQSKGLQADYVFLADCSPNRSRKPDVHVWREGAMVFGRIPLVSGSGFYTRVELVPKGWTKAVEEEARFEQAERMRLLYVAATRACKQLIVSTKVGGTSGTWDVFADVFAGASQDQPPSQFTVDPDAYTQPSGRAMAEEAFVEFDSHRMKKRIEELSIPAWIVQRPSEKEDLPEVSSGFRASQRLTAGADGLKYGSAIHTVLESLVAKRKEDVNRVLIGEISASVVTAQIRGANISAFIERSVKEAGDFVDSSLWASLKGATRVMTEVPFTTSQLVDGVDVVTSGVVDLAFRTEGGWTIVDYKSDNASEEVLLERHASQIEAYLQAWNTIFPGEPNCGIIWATESGRAIPVSDSQAELT